MVIQRFAGLLLDQMKLKLQVTRLDPLTFSQIGYCIEIKFHDFFPSSSFTSFVSGSYNIY